MSRDPQHKPRKRFGQNFLRDQHIIERIVSSINAQADDVLVEIGPGEGAITDYLAPRCKQLQLIEIDRDLAERLNTKYAHTDHVSLHTGDALAFNFSTVADTFRVVGNLPYNISTPLLINLIDHRTHVSDAHFMLQKEVVDRICAPPGNKTYGRLSILLQYYFQTEHLFDVPPESFFPPPKVDSAIIRLTSKPADLVAHNLPLFHSLCKIAFAQRRKTLRNNLKNAFSTEIVSQLEEHIDLTARPETLSVTEFVQLSDLIHDFQTAQHE
ncbi:MAG: 16S rRNA (adenine(1518)-N(6)/adenine(1519)-N(6))-dimethyltransferase RsmA [Pseudomonadota bacterium]